MDASLRTGFIPWKHTHTHNINTLTHTNVVKLIAFELAGEDRKRRENPVVSRLKIVFYALHKRC